MKTWTEVEQSPDYQALRPREREAARQQYFEDAVAPQIPQDELQAAREAFDADTRPRSAGEAVTRQAGLTARAGATGAAAIPTMLGDVLNSGINLGIRGLNAVTGAKVPELPPASAAFERTLSRAGLPEPENATERVAYDINRGMAGAAGPAAVAAVAQPVTRLGKALQELFTLYPGLQIAAGATGGAAGGTVRELGGGPVAQMAAGMAGSLFPSSLLSGAEFALKRSLRGADAGVEQMRDSLAAFREAGTEPTVSQATGSRRMQAVESLLAKVPGSSGVIAARASRQQAEIGQRVSDLADSTYRGADATSVGRAIEKGVRGPGGFVEQFKHKQTELWDRLDRFIAPDQGIGVDRTRQALAQLNAKIPGAEQLSNLFINARIRDAERLFIADLSKAGQLPYEAVKKLRTLVGKEMADSSLLSDVPRSAWKTLYAALSTDLEEAARSVGPDAQAAWTRANRHTAAGMDRLELIDKVIQKAEPEAITRSLLSGTREGATKLVATLRSVPKDARVQLTAYVLKRLGQAKAGAQDASGDLFSTEAFLTNWNSLSKEAKQALFVSDESRTALDGIANAASRIRQGARVYSNPSGTAPALTLQHTGLGAVLLALTGHPGSAAAVGGTLALANLAARRMTDPQFVRWLARTQRMPVEQIPAQLNNLARNATSDQDAQDYLDLADLVARRLEQPEALPQ